MDGFVREEVTPVLHVGLDAKPDIPLWEFWDDDFETITFSRSVEDRNWGF